MFYNVTVLANTGTYQYPGPEVHFFPCDMIKGNELDVGKIDLELQAKRGDAFLGFTLLLNFKESSYLCNQMSN